ncbi:MAG: DNA helicase UvrD [Candidatus Portnoybacteria bacterium CG23_combo_of_CG06-09_8_20_14_all_37_13]|uniref:DNA helicase UvrD n=1 Tax=Candidatus Portnoybacteria bacterium CG23_combo_of_CG06-09_8_20_14_all_37_13 TaxID=1974819 RepID=A0A2G9YD07_9BACT|nr:MAG: DNA helicase UvrD [Candidatus Portnoybacteria bacterium CG23_combo_of_CG06-09_8_20_14_all_37_13]
MKFIADFHIHSKYSRATSRQMDIPNIARWAKIKGIDLMAAPDWTHPKWLEELKRDLKPLDNGLFECNKTKFILVTELSSIYKKGDKVRKIHNLIFAPNFQIVDQINAKLGKDFNLKSDGRPILGLDAKNLLEIILTISKDCLIVPAHAWTPWFSLFGSHSGFDSIKECFEEYSKYIYAIETGLSSDPAMNWRLSALDKITLISNSDAHSPSKLGREANIFNCQLSYKSIINAIKNNKLVKTIEFFPEEGKYHFDGHRACNICLSPEEAKKYKNICPKCGKPLTIGVMHRIDDLADRPARNASQARLAMAGGKNHEGLVPFKRLIPFQEIISEALKVGVNTKAVNQEYEKLIKKFKTEFNILLNVKIEDLEKTIAPLIALGIKRVRQGKVHIEPGYDGEYGRISIFGSRDEKFDKQRSLF